MQLDFNNLTAGQMWVMAIVLCYVGGLAFMAYLTAYFWWKNKQLKKKKFPKTKYSVSWKYCDKKDCKSQWCSDCLNKIDEYNSAR